MNYYQQPNTVVNVSPFQQNIDIIKNYFKKPIVLVNAIIETITIPFIFLMILSVSNWLNLLVREINGGYYSEYSFDVRSLATFSNFFTTFMIIVAIFSCIPAILTVVAKFMIYAKSKNPDPNVKPSAGFTILWVLSIISACAMGLNCLVTIFSMIASIFASSSVSSYSYYGSYSAAETTASLVSTFIISLIMLAVSFFLIINQIRFYSSVRKSLNSIYLKKDGAMVFGIFRIIEGSMSGLSFFTCAFILLVIASMAFSTSYSGLFAVDFFVYLTILVALSAGSSLTSGIITVKYADYIKGITFGINRQFNANLPYSNPVPVVNAPVNPFNNAYAQPQPPAQPQAQPMQNNSYDNMQNENPYTNPQEINPQEPQEPIPTPDNQYYPPVANNVQQEDNPQNEEDTNNNVCPNCGSPVFRSDMFCNNCGFKLK